MRNAMFVILFGLYISVLLHTQQAASVPDNNCVLSKSWCTQIQETANDWGNPPARWGSFRPASYFGLKQKAIGPVLGTGIMWSSSLSAGNALRDQTIPNELTRFEWLRHDGKRFGSESLVDSSYDMTLEASFVVPAAEQLNRNSSATQVPDWFQEVVINDSRETTEGPTDKKSFVFYFGTECVDRNTAACLAAAKSTGWKVTSHEGSDDRGFHGAVSIVGYTESTGWFCLFLIVDQVPFRNGSASDGRVEAPSLSYTGLAGVDLLQGADRVKEEARLVATAAEDQPAARTRRGRKQLRPTLFDDFGDLNSEVDDDASFVAVHVGFTGSIRVDALLYTHLNATSHEELVGYISQAEWEKRDNVLPFWLCTQLQVSHRELVPIPVPTGMSAAPSTVVVETSGRAVSQPEDAPITKEVVRTGTAGDEFSVLRTDEGGPVIPAYCANRGDCIRAEMDQLLQQHFQAFDERFATAFPLDADGDAASAASEGEAGDGGDAVPAVFTQLDIETAKVCLSSLLGGMGYFQGRPVIGVAADVEFESTARALSEAARGNQLVKVNPEASPLSLFTATPSRTAFPRGFLWDEGFHQMLISRWDPALSMEVISSWLNAMHFPCQAAEAGGASKDCVGGWIPREMILGEEAQRRVPDEFVVQRVNIANPPTFLLVVDNLLTRFESVEPPKRFPVPPAPTPDTDALLPAKTGELATFSEDLREDEEHGDNEVVRRYRKSVDPADEQLVHLEHSADREAVLRFLRDIYPQLHRWVQWFLHSQKGSDAYPGSFRWRGRSAADGKVIPNTLASGLDDYPRAPIPSAEEHHLDLHCWMVKATAVMARLHKVLRDTGFDLPAASEAQALMAQYDQQHAYLLQRMEELHWSPELKGFFDVGLNNEEGYFVQEVAFRCSNPRDQSVRDIAVPMEVLRERRQDFCPASHPQPLFPIGDGQGGYKLVERMVVDKPKLSHIPRVGYVTIFPLLLRLLDPYSPQLGALLDIVEDPQKLWTDHGLRSIALTDRFYQRRNSPGDAPYWRGPIWIPINYLALGALNHYAGLEGVYQARASRLYTRLRNNVLQTVLGQYANTGRFWEQYEDATGAGMRGHPFTGWTALVVNIMAEKY